MQLLLDILEDILTPHSTRHSHSVMYLGVSPCTIGVPPTTTIFGSMILNLQMGKINPIVHNEHDHLLQLLASYLAWWLLTISLLLNRAISCLAGSEVLFGFCAYLLLHQWYSLKITNACILVLSFQWGGWIATWPIYQNGLVIPVLGFKELVLTRQQHRYIFNFWSRFEHRITGLSFVPCWCAR